MANNNIVLKYQDKEVELTQQQFIFMCFGHAIALGYAHRHEQAVVENVPVCIEYHQRELDSAACHDLRDKLVMIMDLLEEGPGVTVVELGFVNADQFLRELDQMLQEPLRDDLN